MTRDSMPIGYTVFFGGVTTSSTSNFQFLSQSKFVWFLYHCPINCRNPFPGTLSSLTHYSRSNLVTIFSHTHRAETFTIPCSIRILLCGLLRKHSKCTYTTLKLIQTKSKRKVIKDGGKWWQIQNPMPSWIRREGVKSNRQ